jgi:hypothetical protein
MFAKLYFLYVMLGEENVNFADYLWFPSLHLASNTENQSSEMIFGSILSPHSGTQKYGGREDGAWYTSKLLPSSVYV